MTWDNTFMSAVHLISNRSHDPNTHVGAVIVSDDNLICSWGYNALPRGITYDANVMASSEKYKWTSHAEENAIINAGRAGIRLLDSKLYVNLLPCSPCARKCIQAGISEIIVDKRCHDAHQASSKHDQYHWKESFECTLDMFSQTGMKLRWLDYQLVTQTGLVNGKKYPFDS